MIQPKKITVATVLTGKGETQPKWMEPHGCLQTVTDSPAPGFMRLIMLGAEGLQVRHHENWVVIPTALILALAEKLDPELKPPTPKELQAAAAENGKLARNLGLAPN